MNRVPPAVLDQIRDAVALSSIIGPKVQWDRKKTNAAKHDWWSCCPFHAEKTPSFHVDDRKGFYKCFSCGAHGDHFRFLTEHEGRTFPEAVEELAALAHVSLPEQTPESKAVAARRLTLMEANGQAGLWYRQQLERTPAVMAYVASRGITPQDISRFGIGYAPEGNALQRAAIGPSADMVDAGLLGRGEDGHVFDRFRGRLMFPIMDDKGRTIAFSGRALGADQEPKYLNSPETQVFDKGAILYNGAVARDLAWSGVPAVVVEGHVDVISATRAGAAAAAPMGTALTAAHVKKLVRMAETVTICFDGDAAGRKAADKAIDLILPVVSPAFTATFADLPDGQDPDSMVTKRGAEAFMQAIGAGMPLPDALWRREARGLTPAVPEHRAKLQAGLRAALLLIEDRDTRRAYGDNFKDRLAALGERPKIYRSNGHSQHSTSPGASRLMGGYQRVVGLNLKEAILIGAIAAAPLAAVDRMEALVSDDRLSPEAAKLIGTLTWALAEAPPGAVAEVLASTGLEDVVHEALAKANAAGVAMEIGTEGAAALRVLNGVKRH